MIPQRSARAKLFISRPFPTLSLVCFRDNVCVIVRTKFAQSDSTLCIFIFTLNPVQLEHIQLNIEKRRDTNGFRATLRTGATLDAINVAEERLGHHLPDQVRAFYSQWNGLTIDDPPFDIMPVENLSLDDQLRIHFATADGTHRICFDCSRLNEAEQWDIIDAENQGNLASGVTQTPGSYKIAMDLNLATSAATFKDSQGNSGSLTVKAGFIPTNPIFMAGAPNADFANGATMTITNNYGSEPDLLPTAGSISWCNL